MMFETELENGHYGNIIALKKISIRAEVGQVIGILGANAAGKTTALKAIIGSVSCSSRKLLLDGVDISKYPTWLLVRGGIGFCPDGAPCFKTLTVLENLQGINFVKKRGGSNSDTDATDLLDQVFQLFPVLRDRQKQLAGTLSGGERQMLAIGRILMFNPKVLMLDEPSSGLAPKLVGELYQAVFKIKKNAKAAIVLAEQNAEVALKISDYCVVLEQGRVAVEGTSMRLSENTEVRRAYLGI